MIVFGNGSDFIDLLNSNNKNYKIEILTNEIEDKKDYIKTLSKELLYHKEMLKRFKEKLLNLEWEDFFQD